MACTYRVYSYAFDGRCTVEYVVASDKSEAKLKALLRLGSEESNKVQRQVAEIHYANSHQYLPL